MPENVGIAAVSVEGSTWAVRGGDCGLLWSELHGDSIVERDDADRFADWLTRFHRCRLRR